MTGWGGLLGLLFGLGAYLAVAAYGPLFARTYVLRVEAYLQTEPAMSQASYVGFLGRSRAERIELRQLRAGHPTDAAAHLLQVALWCAGALTLGSGLLATLLALGSLHQPAAALPLLVVCVVTGWLLADRRLDAAAKRRRERAVVELPGIAETLAIAVSAGAALPHACELVAGQAGEVMAGELGLVVDAVRHGVPIDRALAEVGTRLPVPAVQRFLDAMRIALDRGTPIVDVLHAQAADARNESRRLLMERAGRREIAMLIPVVFFVLPAVVVIALYPGFRELTSMV
jgi:tight adherence protein C